MIKVMINRHYWAAGFQTKPSAKRIDEAPTLSRGSSAAWHSNTVEGSPCEMGGPSFQA
jgi:hypothetical protein